MTIHTRIKNLERAFRSWIDVSTPKGETPGIYILWCAGWVNGEIEASQLTDELADELFCAWLCETTLRAGETYPLHFVYGADFAPVWELRVGQPFKPRNPVSAQFLAMREIDAVRAAANDLLLEVRSLDLDSQGESG